MIGNQFVGLGLDLLKETGGAHVLHKSELKHAQYHAISEVNQGIQSIIPRVIKALTLLTRLNIETPLSVRCFFCLENSWANFQYTYSYRFFHQSFL